MKKWIAMASLAVSCILFSGVAYASTKTTTSSAHHVIVVVAKTCHNAQLARAIESYLERSPDSTVKKFTILDVTYKGDHYGFPVWLVKLGVQHYPHKTSAFVEGINYRYLTVRYVVDGLASGM